MYPASERRWLTAPSPSWRSSALRLPVTMNSDADPATMRNHGEIGTPTATPPAIVRSTKPARHRAEVEHRLRASATRCSVTRQHEVAADDERELPPRRERQRDRGGDEHDAAR